MISLKSLLLKLDNNKLLKCINTFSKSIKRKNTDYQWSEYIVYHTLKTIPLRLDYSEIILSFDPNINKGYLNDLIRANKTKVMEYYSSFYDEVIGYSVDNVFLLGKNQNIYPEIRDIHKNKIGVAKFKADVVFKLKSGEYIGISVKSSEKDTLTNYSIYSLLSDIDENKLKSLLKELLLENDLSLMIDDYRGNRKEYNKIFSNTTSINNEYHILLNNLIMSNNNIIIEGWYHRLFGDLPYKLYTFDGKKLLSKVPVLNRISIVPIQNPAKNPRGAAKIFFAIFEGDTILYKWEIRWKGNLLEHAPQILTYNWNPETDIFKELIFS